MNNRPRILTGDTPTGRLHLGHWVGSLENRVALQDDYECFFLLANMHAFTTRSELPADIRRDTLEIVKDWLAAGIDPERSTLVRADRGPGDRRALLVLRDAASVQPGDAQPDAEDGDRAEGPRRSLQLRLSALRGRSVRRHPRVPRGARAGR